MHRMLPPVSTVRKDYTVYKPVIFLIALRSRDLGPVASHGWRRQLAQQTKVVDLYSSSNSSSANDMKHLYSFRGKGRSPQSSSDENPTTVNGVNTGVAWNYREDTRATNAIYLCAT